MKTRERLLMNAKQALMTSAEHADISAEYAGIAREYQAEADDIKPMWDEEAAEDIADAATWVERFQVFYITNTDEDHGKIYSTATVSHAILGDKEIDRDDMVAMFGVKYVETIEVAWEEYG